jgi:hypothetical protein
MASSRRNIKQPLYHIAALLAATVGCTATPSPLVERHDEFIFDSLPPVHVRVLVAPELLDRVDRYLAAAEAALRRFGEWYGPYPHEALTLVDPGWRDIAQIPGTVVLRTRRFSFERTGVVESAVVDAVSRRFWQLRHPMTNADHAAFIEGLSAFSTARALAELLPESSFEEHRYFSGFVPYAVPSHPLANDNVRAARRFAGSSAHRTMLAWATLERYIGWGALQATLWEFAQRRRTNRASPAEFVEILRNSTTHDLDWFVNEVLGSAKVFDYAVKSFESKPAVAGARYETAVVIQRVGKDVFAGSDRSREGPYQSGRGIELRVAFESGDEIREYWDGRDVEARYVYESTTPAVTATIDPEGILQLDANPGNNHRRLGSAPRSLPLAAARWGQWLQHALLTYSFFF